MAFLIDSLKEKFGSSEEDDEKGFDDMHYIVGNTSGMDIGQVPSPIDQRIGRMAQIGGALMELQITNPTTFQIDRPEIINVISQLDLDVTLHGDPNMGFTAAYATRGQGTMGYNIVHRYMKRYIEQMAAFKYEVQQRDDLDFFVGYVNMHASNEQIPPREERLASDVSVDPFGLRVTEINDGKKPNIYRNEEFRRDLFDYFFLQIVDRPFQLYEQIFSDEDEDFKNEWNRAKEEVIDENYYNTPQVDQEQKFGLIQTAASVDQDLGIRFLDELEETELPSSFTLKVEQPVSEDRTQEIEFEFNNLAEVSQQLLVQGRGTILDQPRNLARDVYRIKNKDVRLPTQNNIPVSDADGNFKPDSIMDAIENLIDKLWLEKDQDGDGISVEAKITALNRNLDIQQTQILDAAQEKEEAEKAARKAFADPENDKILENLVSGRYADDFNKESSIFFNIMPAWMQNASETDENHPGWKAPEYIWETIVREEPFDDYEEFDEWLSESRENELDVIAAVGCAYIWGHWTQQENKFEDQAFEAMPESVNQPNIKPGGMYTWTEWMNKFNLKLNIEAMYGDPGQLQRVWRPKDIAVACRAINKTARRQSEEWEEEYRGPIAKFTIDMEHTASYGVDPYQEIKTLIEQEKKFASDTGADDEKPLADIIKTYHLTKPGWEQQQGHRHGPFARGDETLYKWLYKMIENGFARNPDDRAVVMFEVGGEYREEMYVIRVAMDMIERGIKPEDLDPTAVPLREEYQNANQALMARFFGLDKAQFNAEMAKIEDNAFAPLDGLLEAEGFDRTQTGSYAINQAQNRPQEFSSEEYK